MSLLRAKASLALPRIRVSTSRSALAFSSTTPTHLATADEPTTSASQPSVPYNEAHAGGLSRRPASSSGDMQKLSLARPKAIRTNYTVPRRIALPPATDPLLTYFTNIIMEGGKRHQAARQVAEMLNNIHILTHAPPLPILREAVERAGPEVKVVSQKQRNKNVLTPRPLSAKQRTGQAIRWIVNISDKRHERHFEQRLAKEVVAIINSASDVLKKKDEVHKLALANRANASVR